MLTMLRYDRGRRWWGGGQRERRENTGRDKGGNKDVEEDRKIEGDRESLWERRRIVIMHPGSQ